MLHLYFSLLMQSEEDIKQKKELTLATSLLGSIKMKPIGGLPVSSWLQEGLNSWVIRYFHFSSPNASQCLYCEL